MVISSAGRNRFSPHVVSALVILALTASGLFVVSSSSAQAAHGPDVRISELTNYGPGGSPDNFIEIANFGDETADLDGWSIYRCAATGSRVYDPQVPTLEGVKLEPGETFVIAHDSFTGENVDAHYSVSLANAGFGAWIEDADRRLVDSVAVYAAPVDSECALNGTPLPNDLDGGRAQTYQRVDTTGDTAVDFIKAGRTPGEPNATEPDQGVQPSDVLISELTNGGPAGSSDNFVEFANYGDAAVDISGWKFYRCWASGRRTPDSLQSEVPDGTVLQPGQVFVAAHTVVDVPDGVPHARYSVSLANAGFGAMLEDADGNIMDAAGVYEADGFHQAPVGSPCTQGSALPNRLDYGFDQTYQRFQNTGDNASDFTKAPRSIGELVDPDPNTDVDPERVETGVQVSELVNEGPAGGADEFFELANMGDEPVSIGGWAVHRCQGDGRRNANPQIVVDDGVVLAPGETYVAVHESSPMYRDGDFDASYGVGMAADGFGLVVYDADGRVADSVGVYDESFSPCTQTMSVMNIADTAAGETFQRFQGTGENAADFVVADRTPGGLPEDLRAPTDLDDDELAPVDVEPAPRPLPAERDDATPDAVDGTDATLSVVAGHTTGDDAELSFHGSRQIAVNERAARVYTGVTDQAPPESRRIEGERLRRGTTLPGHGDGNGNGADDGAGAGGEPVVVESSDGFPFQRYELTASEGVGGTAEIAWSGRSTGGNELQMYAWNHKRETWDLVDAAGGYSDEGITLIGEVEYGVHVRGRRMDILVQDGPATQAAFADDADEPNLGFKDPAEYDFALGYVTDTQFLSEGYRPSFVDINRWLVTNQDARDIAYTFHTGDLIQRWLNGTHSEARARNEYAFASDVMGILERGGHPYGVTPGNHDDKWGRDKTLFNEYFPVERFESQDSFGAAWREGDSQNHYDVMEIGGAKFLMVYLGYFAGDEAIEWADEVVKAHPDHNVVFATHEYIHADGTLSSPDTYRWTSLGQRFWDELILPNENVFMVLSGHFHGVALNIKRDVGGVEGRVVVEMMANYQGYVRDGHRDTGFLRLLQVDLDAKKMAVNTYSPRLDEHNAWEYDPEDRYDDADDEFTVDVDLNNVYDKRVEADRVVWQSPSAELGAERVAAGAEAAIVWEDLEPGASYAWYVRSEDDGGRRALSPVWSMDVAAEAS
ncbi:lamin tail domain-containing protein [Phytoactinopolyspora halotolerans]|uniref:LTD domain-containing protein n=1 Tax=Phytoactinopolyspora halotolerans TaxID=1981512 RepID=A0A6L9SDL3_9ACTN|nr:lamin tail domain-containing protein [Phytoactinopolyspora halotolerans]NEE02684.1 hypothetical protein [Phytoactinopolyspora halotolerans]